MKDDPPECVVELFDGIYSVDCYCEIIKCEGRRCDYVFEKGKIIGFIEENSGFCKLNDISQLEGCVNVLRNHIKDFDKKKILLICIGKKDKVFRSPNSPRIVKIGNRNSRYIILNNWKDLKKYFNQ